MCFKRLISACSSKAGKISEMLLKKQYSRENQEKQVVGSKHYDIHTICIWFLLLSVLGRMDFFHLFSVMLSKHVSKC